MKRVQKSFKLPKQRESSWVKNIQNPPEEREIKQQEGQRKAVEARKRNKK